MTAPGIFPSLGVPDLMIIYIPLPTTFPWDGLVPVEERNDSRVCTYI